MGALDVLTKMVNLDTAMQRGRAQKEDSGQITSDMKYLAAQQQAQQKQQFDTLKYVTGRYTDLYFKANGNRALQENVLTTMNNMKESLPPIFRQQFEMFTHAGPFSEVKEKERKFNEIYGTGPRELTHEEAKDSMMRGRHEFEKLDYINQKQTFLSGKDLGRKRTYVSLADGNILARTDDNYYYATDTETLGIKAKAEELGINPGKLLADDGIVFGTERKGFIQGKPVSVTPYQDAFGNRKSGSDITYGKMTREEKPWDTPELSSLLTNFMAGKENIVGNSEGARMAKRIISLIEEIDVQPAKSFKEALQSNHPSIKGLNNAITTKLNVIPEFRDLTFKLVDPDYDTNNWYDPSWGVSENAILIAIPGTAAPVITKDKQERKIYYYQGNAYDANGNLLGKWADAEYYISTKTAAELDREGL